MVLSPAPPSQPTAEEQASRTLAYQQAISKEREAGSDAKDEAAADIPPFETVTSAPPATTGATAGPSDLDVPPDMAALPDESADTQDVTSGWPGEGGVPSQDMAAVPGGPPAPYDGAPAPDEAGPGPGQWDTDGAEQWGDESDTPWAAGPPPGDPYGPPGQGDPYADPYGPRGQANPYGPPGQAGPYGAPAQGDPYGPPQADQWGGQGQAEWADQNTEQWVRVIISGAAMRAEAAEDAPMLFAFPYGRNLQVVSRFEGWVEVTDPKSAATGWMQAHMLAPTSVNQQPHGQTEAYYDDEPRRRGGWFKRNGGGFADMINRALGGGH